MIGSQFIINVSDEYQSILEKYRDTKIENNLAEVYPELALEWHPTKNGELEPGNIPAVTSATKYWGKCSKCGYEWEAQLNNRINRRFGKICPCCAGKVTVVGVNDLQTTFPKIALEWHPIKNGNLLPTMIVGGSNKKIWWKCREGHEWQASPNKRTEGTGCPECWKKRIGKASRKTVIQYTLDGVLIQSFDSLTDAANTIGTSASGISKCCNGKAKSAAGFVWKWKL